MEKFKNKYRIPSARLQSWDYGTNGIYFITICTQNRECFFGEIIDYQFVKSELGELANRFWYEIPTHFPFVELDAFVVMPNHIHGIIIIDKPDDNGNLTKREDIINSDGRDAINSDGRDAINSDGRDAINSDGRDAINSDGRDAINRVSTSHELYEKPTNEPKTGGITGNKNPMLHENISRIIRWYKGRCAFEMRKIHADFAWQARYYDHIIRNNESFEKIHNYIINNPKKWDEDKFNNSNQ